jgi:hypothetical protein
MPFNGFFKPNPKSQCEITARRAFKDASTIKVTGERLEKVNPKLKALYRCECVIVLPDGVELMFESMHWDWRRAYKGLNAEIINTVNVEQKSATRVNA